MKEEERVYRNVTAEAMLRHVRVVTKDNTVQLWLGATHIVNVEPESIPAIALQAFAADQPHALSVSITLKQELETVAEELMATSVRVAPTYEMLALGLRAASKRVRATLGKVFP